MEAPLHCPQETNYPWDGKIVFTIKEAPSKETAIHFRIPGWCKKYQFKVNGKAPEMFTKKDDFISGDIKSGDKLELNLDMPAHCLNQIH
jgi:DUF1680 family protein